jgi:N-acetylglucosaminyldiphosphoundecaprenol N-acetyl-beta-D-mannosaminyltransferase
MRSAHSNPDSVDDLVPLAFKQAAESPDIPVLTSYGWSSKKEAPMTNHDQLPSPNRESPPPDEALQRQGQEACLLGYHISTRGLRGDTALAFELIRSNASTAVVDCINPHSIVVAKKDQAFRDALSRASILLPDGAGIVLGAKVLGLPIRERVAGTEFFLGLSQLAQQAGGTRYFFLGSTTTVLGAIAQKLAQDFPSIELCGTLSPPFKETFLPEDNREIVEAVNAASPDVLWVGMTAPKQEKWIEANRAELRVPLICAIGAVFDFYSDTKSRPPAWVRDAGLEWLARWAREPRRLWKRNFISMPLYLKDLFSELLKQTFNFKKDT